MSNSDGFDEWEKQASENLGNLLSDISQQEVSTENKQKAYFDLLYMKMKIEQFLQLFEIYERGKREDDKENGTFVVDEDDTAVMRTGFDDEEAPGTKEETDLTYIG